MILKKREGRLRRAIAKFFSTNVKNVRNDEKKLFSRKNRKRFLCVCFFSLFYKAKKHPKKFLWFFLENSIFFIVLNIFYVCRKFFCDNSPQSTLPLKCPGVIDLSSNHFISIRDCRLNYWNVYILFLIQYVYCVVYNRYYLSLF